MQKREKFASRLGFILVSAGCAIGLGNVWRFPYVVGQYGGGMFVLIYLLFLLMLGLPIMIMEFSVGRASHRSIATSFHILEPKGTKWHLFSYFAMGGNYLLMMFYTTIAGWLIAYLYRMTIGTFSGMTSQMVVQEFELLTSNPFESVAWMIAITVLGFFICALGLKNGVEKVSKFIMTGLLLFMIILVVRAVTLPNALEGLKFFLLPNIDNMIDQGIGTVVFAAMGQAFFTLSIGIGSMAIFGSYHSREQSLTGESIGITILDTSVAMLSGLIIFPACFAFNISPDSGPKLIFVTLPNIFNAMPGGRIWGVIFFICMGFAAFSTVIAVFENIVSFGVDLFGWSKQRSSVVNIFIVVALSLPCTLGFNLLGNIQPLGAGTTILDLEDFIVSNNLLPLGALIFLLFCVTRYGWGWDKFIAEADCGKGLKFPKWARFYLVYILPVIFLFIFVQGYVEKFS